MDILFQNAAYMGSDFKDNLALMKAGDSPINLKVMILEKRMGAEEVVNELKPVAVNLGELVSTLKNDPRVLKNGSENIFFIIDKNNVLKAVVAYYFEDGWHFGANLPYNTLPCQCRFKWPVGSKVFYN